MLRPAALIFLSSLMSVVTSSRGPLVMIGGGLEEDNEAVWGRMMEEAGGEGVSVWFLESILLKPHHISGCQDRDHHRGQH